MNYPCSNHAIADDPPATLQNTGIIRSGYSAELDGVIEASRHAREWINNLEAIERQRTGIKTLKVGYNKVFGYYIEISQGQAVNAPSDYIRKQTLGQCRTLHHAGDERVRNARPERRRTYPGDRTAPFPGNLFDIWQSPPAVLLDTARCSGRTGCLLGSG